MDLQAAPSSSKTFVKKNTDEEKCKFFHYSPSLINSKSVTEKMKHLCSLSSLTSYDIKERAIIREKVLKTLKPFYPDCQVYIYGSTGNGFGTKGSDLDLLFLPYPSYCRRGREVEEEPPPDHYLVENGQFLIDRQDMERLGEKAHLEIICHIFKKVFKRTLIIRAKCPIVSFISTGQDLQICCDLSCRNKLVVHNTELLKFFNKIDPRVAPLVITLRFWSKAMALVSAFALSSYAFTLLVIFFLQNTSPPILPSVDFLMDLTDENCCEAHWAVSFSNDLSMIPANENQDSEGELLQKFFSFYWNFDFTRNIVCIRTGKAEPIKEMVNSHLKDDFQISAMCIQDPFDLSHNVGKNMNHISVSNFKPLMLLCSNILTSNPDSVDTFEMLFDRTELIRKVHSEFYFQNSQTYPSILIPLDHQIIAALGDRNDVLEKFYEKASKRVFDVLCYGLLMDSEIIDMQCVYGDRNCLMSIQSSVYDRVWIGRQQIQVPLDYHTEHGSHVLKMQQTISNIILTTHPEYSCSKPVFWFLCECYKTNYSQIPYLIVQLSPITRSKEFKQIHKFLRSLLPNIVKEILSENNQVAHDFFT